MDYEFPILTPVEVTTWSQYQRLIDLLPDTYIYRGQENAVWPLSTRLHRACPNFSDPNAHHYIEQQLLADFRGRVHHHLPEHLIPKTNMEALSLMQHHGAPTRLLDFTHSPYIAAFFAVRDASTNAAIWALDSWILGAITQTYLIEHEEVDPNLPKVSRHLIQPFQRLPDDVCEHYIKKNNGHFVGVARDPRQNQRLSIQQGAFLFPGTTQVTLEHLLLTQICDYADCHLQQFIIPKDQLFKFRHELRRMNICEATLFPGLDGFARGLAHNIGDDSLYWDTAAHREPTYTTIREVQTSLGFTYDPDDSRPIKTHVSYAYMRTHPDSANPTRPDAPPQ